ncbi:MAG: hypothetical protein EP318_18535 [Rhodobacteraceae bacterium]|nr:MAG: hypothetical protein EP318_18535 [Paracoccaceae bacterium]
MVHPLKGCDLSRGLRISRSGTAGNRQTSGVFPWPAAMSRTWRKAYIDARNRDKAPVVRRDFASKKNGKGRYPETGRLRPPCSGC